MSAGRALTLVALLGCARAPTPSLRALPPEFFATTRVGDVPPWRSLLANSLPMPLRSLSAASADTAAVLAESGAFLVRSDEVKPLCEEATDHGAALLDVAAEGGSVWVLGLADRTVWARRRRRGLPQLTSPGRTPTANATLRLRQRDARGWSSKDRCGARTTAGWAGPRCLHCRPPRGCAMSSRGLPARPG
ncbi:MAG: hypothetical protein U0325_20060 [Polyangiales bacterium]